MKYLVESPIHLIDQPRTAKLQFESFRTREKMGINVPSASVTSPFFRPEINLDTVEKLQLYTQKYEKDCI